MFDTFRDFAFQLRRRAIGQLKLRSGLPAVSQEVAANPEIAFYQILLDAISVPGVQPPQIVCDVGCRNWSYVRALRRSFPRAQLFGLELDGFRRYLNLWRRMDYAAAHGAAVGGTAITGDFLKVSLEELFRGDTILWTVFFPFVSCGPCHGWGLPSKYSDFSALVAKIVNESQRFTEARVLSAHQGAWEAEIAREVYAAHGLRVIEKKIDSAHTSSLWPSPYDTFVFSVLVR